MRKLLAASLIGLSVLAVSDVADAQGKNPVREAPQCVTAAYVREHLADAGLEERAYLTDERAQRLLQGAGGSAPPTATAVLVLRVIGQPARLVVVLFNEQGCQVAMGVGPADQIERLIAPPGREA